MEEALAKTTPRDLEDFKALVSPAASDYLEDMARLSHELTLQRFGNTIQMYIPMYLSNECQNICTYCGFSFTNKIPRKTLSDEEIIKEVDYIRSLGYEHILLVTGEANQTVGVSYINRAISLIKDQFSHISIEVQPMEQQDYELLIDNGLNTVLVYQETYHQEDYKKHHPKGKKSNFHYRLDTPDRLGKAGIHKSGWVYCWDWKTGGPILFFVPVILPISKRHIGKQNILSLSRGCARSPAAWPRRSISMTENWYN